MRSSHVILLVAGAVLTVSAHDSSLQYQHFYEDDEYSQEDVNLPKAFVSYKDQDYYGDDVREGREEEVEEEEEEVGEEYDEATPADYDATGEFPRRVYHEVTSPTPPTHDPLDDARRMAMLNIMDRLLMALGPDFREELPKAPTNDTLATVPTPINITAEPCPYKYKRCSSQTSFPLCEIPHNSDPHVWSQRFNLYFNLTADFDRLDIINATLRLYKNNSIPLHYPKILLIKAYAYNRSLTRRRSRKMLVAEKSILSDYIGWVTLDVQKIVRRWRKARNNHGLLITVTDADTIPWDATNIFVTMSCSSGNNSLVPLPFEVQTDEVGQRYPALNVRQGSPVDEFPVGRVIPSPKPVIHTDVVSGYIQSDDPDVSDDEYDMSQSSPHRQLFPGSHSATDHNNYPHSVGDHSASPHNSHPYNSGSRRPIPNNYPYGTDLVHEEDIQESGHASRSGHEHTARGTGGHDSASYLHGTPHHAVPINYLITNQATNNHHSSSHQYDSGVPHTRNPDHSVQGSIEHQIDSRTFTTQSTTEDTIHSQNSEEQIHVGDWVSQRVSNPSPETSRVLRQRYSGNTKERRHRRKHHHQHSRRGEKLH